MDAQRCGYIVGETVCPCILPLLIDCHVFSHYIDLEKRCLGGKICLEILSSMMNLQHTENMNVTSP